jgi:hypothetical protein
MLVQFLGVFPILETSEDRIARPYEGIHAFISGAERRGWPGQAHDCRFDKKVAGNRGDTTTGPVAGLDPAIHAFPRLGRSGFQDVDARIKSGQGVLSVVFAFRIAVLRLLQRLNRTAVGQARPRRRTRL